MRVQLWSLIIGSFLCKFLEAKVEKIPIDKLGLHNNYNEIVRDVIKNWDSPIAYLRQLGYLPRDYEDTSKIKPNLDALMSRLEQNDDEKEAFGQEEDKYKQLFCGTDKLQTKKKRENVFKLKKSFKNHMEIKERQQRGTQDLNYPSVDQLMAMKQPSLAVALSAAKADDLMPRQKTAGHHSSQLILLSHLLAKQQSEPVHPQSDGQKLEGFLHQIEDKSSPQIGSAAMTDNFRVETESDDAKSKMSTYGTLLESFDKISHSSRQDQAQSKIQIEAPQYLNWDLDNNKLKQISPLEKNMYVDKLVRIYVKKQETEENPQPQQKQLYKIFQ